MSLSESPSDDVDEDDQFAEIICIIFFVEMKMKKNSSSSISLYAEDEEDIDLEEIKKMEMNSSSR